MNKKIYLFDEPTASLDNDSARDVIRMMEEMSRLNKTIVVVSHDIRVSKHVDIFIKMK
jgi:ABC-type lipoprotein export system ATPase subunit